MTRMGKSTTRSLRNGNTTGRLTMKRRRRRRRRGVGRQQTQEWKPKMIALLSTLHIPGTQTRMTQWIWQEGRRIMPMDANLKRRNRALWINTGRNLPLLIKQLL